MSAIDKVLSTNTKIALGYDPRLISPRPRKALAVLTCMDTRLSSATLGLEPQDAHFIRNAGGIATEDAIRSLLVSHYMLGTAELMVINHTDCGLMKSSEEEIRGEIARRSGHPPPSDMPFYSFRDVEANVLNQLATLDANSWLSKRMTIRGFVFEVETGHLREVSRRG